MMGAGLSKLFAPGIKAKLSESQWEYIAFGPYLHWTMTRRALVKRGIYESGGRILTPLGEAVRKLVLADLPHPEKASGMEARQGGNEVPSEGRQPDPKGDAQNTSEQP